MRHQTRAQISVVEYARQNKQTSLFLMQPQRNKAVFMILDDSYLNHIWQQI